MKIIIAGGRDFKDYFLLEKECDRIIGNYPDMITIVSGAARGADSLGEQYALFNNYFIERYPADWDRYGKAAGYRRNEQMAQNADVLIAFWDGQSKGTKHMIDLAKTYELKVFVIRYDGGQE